MRFSDITDLAPASASVATVTIRGRGVDMFRLRAKDITTVMAKAPKIVAAWIGDDGAPDLMAELAVAGDEILNHLIAAGLRATVDQVEKADLDLDEQLAVVSKILEEGIPAGFFEQLKASMGTMTSRLGLDLSQATSPDNTRDFEAPDSIPTN